MGKEEERIFEKKFLLAQDKPDEFFDLAQCGLKSIPEKVYAFCKVLQKKVLLLNGNKLKNINSPKFAELSGLEVLDLSHNVIESIPKQIVVLENLQKLDLSFNRIKKLPEEIGCLFNLQNLNLKGNRLTYLPPGIKKLRELQILDIRENKDLTQLPVNLCYLTNLTEFYFDKEQIKYPPKEVSWQGIQEIKRWFMLIKGDEFTEEMMTSQPKALYPKVLTSDDNGALEESIKLRELEKENKRQQQLELEKRIQDVQTENALLVSAAAKERQALLANVAFEEMKNQSEIHRVYEESGGNRSKFLQALCTDEERLNDTVSLVLQMTERAQRTEELLDIIEAERQRTDELFRITQEETDRLKKEEVLRCMTIVMEDLRKNEMKFAEYERSRDETAKLALRSFNDTNEGIEALLSEREEQKSDLLKKIASEEEAQMAAFKALQFQKDAKLIRIRQQIELIESELKRISMLEMEKRAERENTEMNHLAEMRLNTAILLSQLIDEQEKRENELVKRLKEMEDYKEDEAKDYWLIQFQRLLDSKPSVLVDEENELDVYIVEILMNANAKEYLPMFARKKVTKKQMDAMTHDELDSIGIHDEKTRNNILEAIENNVKLNQQMIQKQSFARSQSVAQEVETVGGATASAPPAENVLARFEGECVVCMEEKPSVIFLNCGHICTCARCSRLLETCPLCRETIVQKCHLFGV